MKKTSPKGKRFKKVNSTKKKTKNTNQINQITQVNQINQITQISKPNELFPFHKQQKISKEDSKNYCLRCLNCCLIPF